jgi:hypothetical protein
MEADMLHLYVSGSVLYWKVPMTLLDDQVSLTEEKTNY